MKGEMINDKELEGISGGRALTYTMDSAGGKVIVEWTGMSKGSTVVPIEKWDEYKKRCEGRGETLSEANTIITGDISPVISKKIKKFFQKLF